MTEAYIGITARARKNVSAILQRLAMLGQDTLAERLNVHESTISRMKTPTKDGKPSEIEEMALFLAAVGLKAVPLEMKCYDPKDIEPLLRLAQRHLAQVASADELAFDDPE